MSEIPPSYKNSDYPNTCGCCAERQGDKITKKGQALIVLDRSLPNGTTVSVCQTCDNEALIETSRKTA